VRVGIASFEAGSSVSSHGCIPTKEEKKWGGGRSACQETDAEKSARLEYWEPDHQRKVGIYERETTHQPTTIITTTATIFSLVCRKARTNGDGGPWADAARRQSSLILSPSARCRRKEEEEERRKKHPVLHIEKEKEESERADRPSFF
jgi:hypothetical protein